jgi:membrane protein
MPEDPDPSTPPDGLVWQRLLAGGYRVLFRAAMNFRVDGCSNYCGAISFFALLSFFPILLLVFSLLGAIFGSSGPGIQDILYKLHLIFPHMAPSISQTINKIYGGRALVSLVSAIILFVVSTRVFAALEFSINDIFKAIHIRSVLRAKLKAAIMTAVFCGLLGALFITSSLLALLRDTHMPALDRVLSFFSQSFVTEYLLPFLVAWWIFHVVFHRLPHVKVRRKYAAIVAGFTALAWELLKYLFGVYLTHLKNVDVLYGPFTAMIFFLLWIYFSTAIIFYGAEVLAILNGNRS